MWFKKSEIKNNHKLKKEISPKSLYIYISSKDKWLRNEFIILMGKGII